MKRLEELLSIVDTRKRHRELIKYAQSLNVKYSEAIDPYGDCNEEQLAILIYDALRGDNANSTKDNKFLVLGVVLAIFLIVSMLYLSQVFSKIY